MFKVGDIITLGDKVGKITGVSNDQRIGFQYEGNRKHTYTIEFSNIPESEISDYGSTSEQSNDISPTEEGEC